MKVMKPPIVTRGPWKPAGAAASVPAPKGHPNGGCLDGVGSVIEAVGDAYITTAFYDFGLLLIRILCYGLFLTVRFLIELMSP